MKRFWSARPHLVVLAATADDYRAIADLHATGFARGWSASEIEALDVQDTTRTMVVRREGQGRLPPAGFLMLRQLPHEAEILSIAVDPHARGHGFGDTLMRAAIAALQGDRVARLVLEVDGANGAALALYRRLGFRQVGTRKGYYAAAHDSSAGSGPTPSDALVMALDLL